MDIFVVVVLSATLQPQVAAYETEIDANLRALQIRRETGRIAYVVPCHLERKNV